MSHVPNTPCPPARAVCLCVWFQAGEADQTEVENVTCVEGTAGSGDVATTCVECEPEAFEHADILDVDTSIENKVLWVS